MRNMIFGLALALTLLLFDRTCFAKITEADLTNYFKIVSPEMFVDHPYWDDKPNFRKFVRSTFVGWKNLPNDPAQVERCIDRYAEFWSQFVLVVVGHEHPKDVAKFKVFADDEKELPPGARSLAAIVVYAETGEEPYMVRALQMAPKKMYLFTKIHDAQFGSIMDSIIANEAGEEALADDPLQAATLPFFNILVQAYPETVQALMFQNAGAARLKYVFGRFPTVSRTCDDQGKLTGATIKILTMPGAEALNTFIRSLVEAEDIEDLSAYKKDNADILPNIDAEIDTYMLKLSKRASALKALRAEPKHTESP